MNCEEFRQAIGSALEIEPARSDEAVAHLACCAACRAFDDDAKRLRRDLSLERELVATTTEATSAPDDEATRLRRFELLLAAWRSGAADQGLDRGARPGDLRLPHAGWRRVAAAVALVVLGAAIGGLATWWTSRAMAADRSRDDAPRFFLSLLDHGSGLRDPASIRTNPPSEIEQRIVGEYTAWARSLDEHGQLVAADRLSDASFARLRMRAGKVVIDDEPDDGELHIGGFFLIRANSLDEAILLARSSPHLRFGGEIEIRAIDRPR